MRVKKNFIVIIILVFLITLLIFVFSEDKVKDEKSPPDILYEKAQKLYGNGNYAEAMKTYKSIVDDYLEYKKIPETYYGMFKVYKNEEKLLKAKEILKLIINKYSDSGIIETVQEDLENLNIQILFSPIKTKRDISYRVKKGDTLSKIAKKYNTTVGLIKRSNDLESDKILPGMDLKIIKSKFSILVIKSQHILTLKLGDEIIKTYEVSVGRGDYNSTPTGKFEIVNRLIDPVWYKDGKAYSPENPKNVLGSRWMGLSVEGYGIHGTTDPNTIGKNITQGCIRMYNSDVEELFSIIPRGTEVVIM